MPRFSLFLAVLSVACAPRPDLNAERAAILAADSALLAAVQARNADSALAFWTPDARVIGPGQPPYVGQQAIRRMLENSFARPGLSVTWKTTDVVVAPSGDVAYTFGTNAFTVPGPKGRLDTLRAQGVVVWRKTDGRWRAAVDTWTPQGP
jgi:uncharacterized protein (TIGR02246 family)